MREASFIIPCHDNDGEPLTDVHDLIKRELAGAFGGFTAQLTHGGWIDRGKLYDEKGVRYTCAVDPLDTSWQGWHAMARSYGELARQLAVYVVYDGEAEVINF